MSELWTFSPDSEVLLQQCINAAPPPDESNKWVQKFGPRNISLVKNTDNTILIENSPEMETTDAREEPAKDISNNLEEFLDPDFDLFSKITYLKEKCLKTPILLTKLAENLPTATTDKLIHHILEEKDVQNDFLSIFYEHFLPTFFRQNNSRFYTDVLSKIYKNHAEYYKTVLKIIIKDKNIQSSILNDFVLSLNEEGATEFLKNITHTDLSLEQFLCNLFSIYTAYKTCRKTDSIQNYIFSCLKQFYINCVTDKNFGKLLLTFLQHENSLKLQTVRYKLGDVIENHKSPFKRPCETLWNEINNIL